MLSRWNEGLKNHTLVSGSLLALATVLVYSGALPSQFVADDDYQILANPFVLNAHYWHKIFVGSVWSFNSASSHDNFYRPLQILYYWIVYRAAGPTPELFHFLQVLLYAGTGWLVYRLGCEIFEHECAAMLGAVLWLAHPLHVEAVAWIAGMPDAGCGFFFLMAFILFVRAEKDERQGIVPHLVAALVYLPSLFFKEMALSFPLVLLVYWAFLGSQSRASTLREWAGRMLRWTPYLAAAIAYLVIRVAAVGSFGRTSSLWRISPATLASSVALLGQHARLFVLPLGLNPFRTFDLESSLHSPWPWIGLFVLATALWLRQRDAQLGFLVIWWVVTLLPCLDIRQLGTPKVADRFSYIPSVGLCLAMSLALTGRFSARRSAERLVRMAAPALIMTFWVSQTMINIRYWRSDEAFVKHILVQSPNAAYPHVVRGDTLRFREGNLDGAEREYETALSLNRAAEAPLDQTSYESYIGLGAVSQQKGQTEQAIRYYQHATQVAPQLSTAYDCLGAYYFSRRDYATASGYFSSAIKANPQDVMAHIYLANCWIKLGRSREAVEEFHAARTVDPTLKQAYVSEARALDALGDAAAAARVRASYHE